MHQGVHCKSNAVSASNTTAGISASCIKWGTRVLVALVQGHTLVTYL
jgi:hypothetical protein